MTKDERAVNFYDNDAYYIPPCCRPGGRCRPDHQAVRVIRTDGDLAALPVGSVLFDVDRDVIVRAQEGWRYWGDDTNSTEDAIVCLPALLIDNGGDPWHAVDVVDVP